MALLRHNCSRGVSENRDPGSGSTVTLILVAPSHTVAACILEGHNVRAPSARRLNGKIRPRLCLRFGGRGLSSLLSGAEAAESQSEASAFTGTKLQYWTPRNVFIFFLRLHRQVINSWKQYLRSPWNCKEKLPNPESKAPTCGCFPTSLSSA